jgi:hypothetical protein
MDFQQAGRNLVPGMRGVPKQTPINRARSAAARGAPGGGVNSIAQVSQKLVRPTLAKLDQYIAKTSAKHKALQRAASKAGKGASRKRLMEEVELAKARVDTAMTLARATAARAQHKAPRPSAKVGAGKIQIDEVRRLEPRAQAVRDKWRAENNIEAKPAKAQLEAELGQGPTMQPVESLRDLVSKKRRLDGGPGGKQGGFIMANIPNAVVGGVAGAVGAGSAMDGDPLAIALGALGGGWAGLAGGKALSRYMSNKQKAGVRAASKAGQEYVDNVSRAGKLRDLSKDTVAAVATNGRQVFDSFLGATMTRLEVLVPRVATALKQAEYQQHERAGHWLERGDKYFDIIEAAPMTDAQRKAVEIAAMNSTDNAVKMLRKMGHHEAADAMVGIQQIIDEVGGYLGEVGLDSGLRKGYMPRQVTDLEYFEDIKEVRTLLEQAAKKKGIDLTDFEKEQAITAAMNDTLGGHGESIQYARASKNLKKRTQKVDNTNFGAYAPTHQAYNDMIESVTTQVERRRFFKGQGVKVDDLGPNAENIETVATRLKDALIAGDITAEQADEAARLIRMRFGPGEQAPHRLVQNFKNLTYTGLLGNPIAAMTQFGDLALSAYKNGIINTTRSVVENLAGRGKIDGVNAKTLLGIRQAAADFQSKTGTRDILNWSLKYSGFQWTDRLGKDTFIKAALMKNKQMGPDDFRSRWKGIFDPDAKDGATPRTDELYKKVQNFKQIDETNREDIGFMLWNSLNEVQPVALSALPEQYLKNPNGRMGYMLQSFTLKLFDVMRKDIQQQAAKGNYSKAIMDAGRLVSLFTLTNGTVDQAKNFILGKDETIPEVVYDNFLKLGGMNKYVVGNVARDGAGMALMKMIAPPTVLGDAIFDPRKALQMAPIVGRPLESRIKDDAE